MNLVYRGAEADIYSGHWAGEKAIFKIRKPLPYRLPELDAEIRRQRTIREAELLHESRLAGVKSPSLFYVSTPESLIVMEELVGPRLKSILQSSAPDKGRVSSEFGMAVGKLHAAGVMHGDLTSSNVIVNDSGVHLIDFGLAVRSARVEDHAVDLRLIKETLVGAHWEVSASVMASFVEGYIAVVGERRAKEVTRKLAEIERRGRYARVE